MVSLDSDIVSMMMFIKFVAEGLGVAKDVAVLAKKIESGESISQDAIDIAREKVKEAVADWDDAGGMPAAPGG